MKKLRIMWYTFWLGSWNLNDDLFPVRRRVKYTRPLMYNTKGRASGNLIFWYIVGFIVGPWIVYFLQEAVMKVWNG